MTDSNDLLVRREDGVLVLTFNRPEHRNALTLEIILEVFRKKLSRFNHLISNDLVTSKVKSVD